MSAPTWEPHRYGGGESLTLAPGLVLSTEYAVTREHAATPWRWQAWGLTSKKRFETSSEAKASAVRFARKTLATGVAALGEAP